jgi:hypothetical protein
MTPVCALCTMPLPNEQTLLWERKGRALVVQLICAACAERPEFEDRTADVIGVITRRNHLMRRKVETP